MGGDEIVVHQQVLQSFSHRIAPRRTWVGLEEATAVGGELIERVSHAISPDVSEIQSTCFLTRAFSAGPGRCQSPVWREKALTFA
jgi:hypothetical protein